MPLRYGINLPAWFHPMYPPSAPVQPKVPQQQYLENKEVLVQRVFAGGISIPKMLDILSNYNSEEYYIDNSDYSTTSAFCIMKAEKYEVIIDEKEFNKQKKEYIKLMKEYEKAEVEYRLRIKKYPAMLSMYEEAKLREKLIKEEDEYEEALIKDSNSKILLFSLKKSIDDTKKAMLDFRSDVDSEDTTS